MNTVKCPSCGHENKNTNIKCEACQTKLNYVAQEDVKTINLGSKKFKFILNAILIFITAPFFLGGLFFTYASSYSLITDYNKSKNYLETEGKLVGYDNCRADNEGDEMCKAIYEYKVDGVVYNASPNASRNQSGYSKTATVKYNPNNPSEYIMDSGWISLLITGIAILGVVLTIIISINVALKKLVEEAKKYQKDNQVTTT